jgi:YVTN family beta-propeller protein
MAQSSRNILKFFCQLRSIALLIMSLWLLTLLSGCGGISAHSSTAAAPSPTPTPVPSAVLIPKVYATDALGSLFVFNAKDQTLTSSPVSGGPEGIAITPDGLHAYITQEISNSVAVVDTRQNIVVQTISVGSSPFGIAISPDGAFAYVTNLNDSTVSVIDIIHNTVVNTIFTGSTPWAVGFSASGEEVYVSLIDFFGSLLNDGVLVIDAETQTIKKSLPLFGVTSMAASPTRHEMYLVEQGFGLMVIDTIRNEIVSQIPLSPEQQLGIDVSPDGKLIYVIEHGLVDIGHEDPRAPTVPSKVYVISADQRIVMNTAETDPGLVAIALSPDGKTAYLLSDDTSLQGFRMMDTQTFTFTGPQSMAGEPFRLVVSAR